MTTKSTTTQALNIPFGWGGAVAFLALGALVPVSAEEAVPAPEPNPEALASVEVDSSKPFPATLNFQPGPEYADADRKFQGIASIECAPGGRLWATWYGGGLGEGPENYIMLATSGDRGATWSNLKLVVDPPFRASEPGIWRDPRGRLWLMLNLYPKGLCEGDTEMWAIATDNPDDENPAWSEPRLIARNLNNFNEPIVLRSGAWLWPTGNWWKGRDLAHPSHPLLSFDEGKTFMLGGAIPVPPEVREFDEYNVVQRRDGSLWLLTRTKTGPCESFSTDEGRTWTEATPHPFLRHDVSRHFLARLRSGRLLLVKHGAVDEPERTGRTRLMAFLSDDDGHNWRGGLMLDERRVSYPDGCQAEDGRIFAIYDHERHEAKEILAAAFTEEDVLAGEFSAGSSPRLLVNKALGVNPRAGGKVDLKDNADAAPVLAGTRAAMQAGGGEVHDLEEGALLFRDRAYRIARIPAALAGKRFVFSSIDGAAAECVSEGIVQVVTPAPDRNRDSVEAELLRQGFAKAAIPEFLLFGKDARSACSVYQKHARPGESVRFGKWGMLVF